MVRNKTCDRTYHATAGNCGFTLVELLVVIAIIGVLVALLLPAVQAAREAARRSQCTNNVRNVALAVHNYHDTNQKFPPAFLAMKDPSSGDLEKFGGTNINAPFRPNWVIMILPFLEQQPLYDSFVLDDFNVQISDEANRVARGTNLNVMRCASDPYGNELCSKAGGNWARGNYGINMMQDGDIWYYKAWDNNDGPGGRGFGPRKGISFINKSLEMGQVTDGLSNTILLGELRVGLGPVDTRGTWAMGAAGSSAHNHHAVSWGVSPNWCDPGATDVMMNATEVVDTIGADVLRNECMHPWKPGTWSYRSVVRSLHPGGAMIALADASARLVSDFVDKGSYQANTRQDYTASFSDSTKFRVWERLNVSEDGYTINGDF